MTVQSGTCQATDMAHSQLARVSLACCNQQIVKQQRLCFWANKPIRSIATVPYAEVVIALLQLQQTSEIRPVWPKHIIGSIFSNKLCCMCCLLWGCTQRQFPSVNPVHVLIVKLQNMFRVAGL